MAGSGYDTRRMRGPANVCTTRWVCIDCVEPCDIPRKRHRKDRRKDVSGKNPRTV